MIPNKRPHVSNLLKEFVAFMILNYSSGANRFFVFDWSGAILQQAFAECLAKGASLCCLTKRELILPRKNRKQT